jgi:ATP-dependent exoDNAse (exonuclease V) alpha subunit
MEWSPQQDAALVAVSRWIKDRNAPQVFRLFGWAGTGKSTLAIHLAKSVRTVVYAAFTGKAAQVMRKKGCKGAQTIHSLIYTLTGENEGEPRFAIDPESPAGDADLIVIDEVSMVNEQLGADLLSFGTKVLVLGDPFQLPPVEGTGYFTSVEPDIMLTEIHRQAADNPIIRMSIDIREGDGRLQRGIYGDSKIISRDQIDPAEILKADQVIVGKNDTRTKYNGRMRELLDRPEPPVRGDKIICLKNNSRVGLLNGQIWYIQNVISTGKTGTLKLNVRLEDSDRVMPVTTHDAFFKGTNNDMPYTALRGLEQFTYGYAVTCHKSQGSQWDDVYLFNESYSFREHQKNWLYTAVTRAAERITIVS